MARSPFQGTWQDGVRPTVTMAPDAVVYINGESDILGCNNCRRKFDLNKYITSIQVDLNVDSAPGSASINLSIPRHSIDDFFFEGDPVLTPMMEVEIYAKGYFLVEGVPQYYPIFWGLITEVSDNYSGGEHTVSIACADILKWWELCKMNINPAFTQQGGQVGRNYIHGSLFDVNVYDMIWTLAQQSFGDVVQATGSLVSTFKEQTAKQTFDRSQGSIIKYWTERFSQMRSNLLLYGVRGGAVRGDLLYDQQPTRRTGQGQKWVSQAVRQANGGSDTSQLYFDPEDVVPFRSKISDAGQVNFWQSEYQSKLELANACKEAVGFEFFMDVTGDIVFKPPFYNLDVLSNKPVSWIQDIDVIDWNFADSEAEVVTHLQMQGSMPGNGGAFDYGVNADYNTLYAQVIDYHLLRKYGWRTQTYNAEYMANADALFYTGLDILDRFNSRRHRATITVPFRPELRLGFPVYVGPKDQIWYLKGISHSITFGGRAQTQLTLSAKRGKFIAPKGIGTLEVSTAKKTTDEKKTAAKAATNTTTKETTQELRNPRDFTNSQLANATFEVDLGEAAFVPPLSNTTSTLDSDPYAPLILRHPKTGRVVGYPNVAMTYTNAFQPTDDQLQALMGQKSGSDRGPAEKQRKVTSGARSQNLEIQKQATTYTTEKELVDRHMANRYVHGMTSAGTYTYVHDTKAAIKEILQVPGKNIQASVAGEDFNFTTATLRPVSDERGFELIGHYRYGRGVSLRDGSLVLSDTGGANKRAAVETQLALSGGLFETLRAQSQGLGTIRTSYASPAETISKLQPEDLQTAATISPETGAPEFQTAGKNFVESAPLNSPLNAGLPTNVEASQLSNALTIAELAPRDGVAVLDEECLCVTGRSDLAFISTGYQVEFIGPTGTDSSNLTATSVGTGSFGEGQLENQAAQSIIDEQNALAEERSELITTLNSDPILDPNSAFFDSAARAQLEAQITAIETQKAALEAQLEQVQDSLSQIDAAGPIFNDDGSAARPLMGGGIPTPSRQNTVAAVDKFLVDLYEALDAPHQEFEQKLRGKFVEGPTRAEILGSTFPQDSDSYGELSPPFSPMGRAIGGDPAALARQGSTAIDDMGAAWKAFGEDLQREPEKAELQENIERLEDKIQDLDREEERLQAIQDSGSTELSPDGSVTDRLSDIQSERSQAVRELGNARGRLQVIRNSEASNG